MINNILDSLHINNSARNDFTCKIKNWDKEAKTFDKILHNLDNIFDESSNITNKTDSKSNKIDFTKNFVTQYKNQAKDLENQIIGNKVNALEISSNVKKLKFFLEFTNEVRKQVTNTIDKLINMHY